MSLTTNTDSLQVRNDLGFAISPPTSILVYVLAAGVARDINIATDFIDAGGKRPKYMDFKSSGNFYVKWEGAGAAVPTVDITTGEGVELNPGLRLINSTSSCSIVSPNDAIVTINLFN